MTRKRSAVPSDPVDINEVMDMCSRTLHNEIRKLVALSEDSDETLQPHEAGQLVKYTGALIALAKDARESTLKDEIGKMSDEELEALHRAASAGADN